MNTIGIICIALSLSADAFAAALSKGLTLNQNNTKESIIIAGYFGLFQAIMPLIGYAIASIFDDFIVNLDHWIAFLLLLMLGIKSIKERNKETTSNNKLDIKTMLILALATSIDALAIGITFAFLDINIYYSSTIIGIITFTTSIIGVKIGNKVGQKYKSKSQILSGIMLIIIGLKILLEHLYI